METILHKWWELASFMSIKHPLHWLEQLLWLYSITCKMFLKTINVFNIKCWIYISSFSNCFLLADLVRLPSCFMCVLYQWCKMLFHMHYAVVTQSFYRPWAGVPPVIFAKICRMWQPAHGQLKKIQKNVHKFHRRWAGGRPAVCRLSAGALRPTAGLSPTLKKLQIGGRMAVRRPYGVQIVHSLLACK